MSEDRSTRWQRLCAWLAMALARLAIRIDRNVFFGMSAGDWQLIPIHTDDQPGVWVTMSAPEYQLLTLFDYPTPPDQEIDWDLEPGDMDEDRLAAVRREIIDVAREVMRTHIEVA